MSKHFIHLKELLNRGKLIMAGPTLREDDPMGVYIFEVESEEEARELLSQDPAIIAGIQTMDDFRPMRVSLLRGMALE